MLWTVVVASSLISFVDTMCDPLGSDSFELFTPSVLPPSLPPSNFSVRVFGIPSSHPPNPLTLRFKQSRHKNELLKKIPSFSSSLHTPSSSRTLCNPSMYSSPNEGY